LDASIFIQSRWLSKRNSPVAHKTESCINTFGFYAFVQFWDIYTASLGALFHDTFGVFWGRALARSSGKAENVFPGVGGVLRIANVAGSHTSSCVAGIDR
jgi:hypothetical protein